MDWNRSHGLESFSWTGIVLMDWNRSHALESLSCTGIDLMDWNRSHGLESFSCTGIVLMLFKSGSLCLKGFHLKRSKVDCFKRMGD